MNSIIGEIFYGNRESNDTVRVSENYKKTAKKVSAVYDEITARISPELKPQFEKFCALSAESEALAAEDNFIEGVKLGSLLGVESSN